MSVVTFYEAFVNNLITEYFSVILLVSSNTGSESYNRLVKGCEWNLTKNLWFYIRASSTGTYSRLASKVIPLIDF